MVQINELTEIIQAKEENDNPCVLFGENALDNNQFDILRQFLTFKPSLKDNLAEEIIKEKLRFQKATLVQLVNLIVERERVKKRNIASLDSEIMECQAHLYLYKCHIYPINPDNKRKSNLERALSQLENQRRQEEIDCWKDTFRLWQEVLKIASEYRAMLRKIKMITLPFGDEKKRRTEKTMKQ
ncbi:MAG: hypothetical protein ABIL44_00905 [candidate division WOR-3 bacterium]